MKINFYRILTFVTGSLLVVLLIIIFKANSLPNNENDLGFHKDLFLLIYSVVFGWYALLLIYLIRRSKKQQAVSVTEIFRLIVIILSLTIPLVKLFNYRFITSLLFK